MAWQPARTAPQDGTKILGGCNWEPITFVVFWDTATGKWCVAWDHEPIEHGYELTHWQPIEPMPELSDEHS